LMVNANIVDTNFDMSMFEGQNDRQIDITLWHYAALTIILIIKMMVSFDYQNDINAERSYWYSFWYDFDMVILFHSTDVKYRYTIPPIWSDWDNGQVKMVKSSNADIDFGIVNIEGQNDRQIDITLWHFAALTIILIIKMMVFFDYQNDINAERSWLILFWYDFDMVILFYYTDVKYRYTIPPVWLNWR
jgi:hypothetical protein